MGKRNHLLLIILFVYNGRLAFGQNFADVPGWEFQGSRQELQKIPSKKLNVTSHFGLLPPLPPSIRQTDPEGLHLPFQEPVDPRLFVYGLNEGIQNPGIPLSFDGTPCGTVPPPPPPSLPPIHQETGVPASIDLFPMDPRPTHPNIGLQPPIFRPNMGAQSDPRLFVYRRNDGGLSPRTSSSRYEASPAPIVNWLLGGGKMGNIPVSHRDMFPPGGGPNTNRRANGEPDNGKNKKIPPSAESDKLMENLTKLMLLSLLQDS